jgi:hypothetical protein
MACQRSPRPPPTILTPVGYCCVQRALCQFLGRKFCIEAAECTSTGDVITIRGRSLQEVVLGVALRPGWQTVESVALWCNATYLRTFPQVNGPSGDTRAQRPAPMIAKSVDAGFKSATAVDTYLFRSGVASVGSLVWVRFSLSSISLILAGFVRVGGSVKGRVSARGATPQAPLTGLPTRR